MNRILGIDSSTKTGLVVLDDDEPYVKLLKIENTVGFERLQLIAANFEQFLEARRPQVAFIENYALGLQKSGDTVITQVEIGTILRMVLYKRRIPWRLIRPNTLKLWVGGPGYGGMKKDQMGRKVQERWGFTNSSDDVVDAYALARMGQFLLEASVEQYPKGVEYGYGAI